MAGRPPLFVYNSGQSDLIFIIGVFVFVVFVWFAVGGADEARREPGFFINPPAPLGSGAVYGQHLFQWDNTRYSDEPGASDTFGIRSIQDELTRVGQELTRPVEYANYSPYVGKIVITQNAIAAASGDPSTEYMTLRNISDERITITNWRLFSSISGNSATIPEGSRLPLSGGYSIERAITLNPGEYAIVTTGRSPIGLSFLTNRCTGYFAQFQTYTPYLDIACPLPVDEMRFAYDPIVRSDDECFDYVSSLRSCSLELNPPPHIHPACRQFVQDELTYSGCVENHRSDANFYGIEWRVYLKREQNLWGDRREVVQLLDESGRIVDVLSY